MKKITLLAAVFVAFAMNAQTVLYENDFETEVAGDNVGEDTDIPADFMSYDVDTNRWSSLAPMPTPRYATFSFLIDDKLYVLGNN